MIYEKQDKRYEEMFYFCILSFSLAHLEQCRLTLTVANDSHSTLHYLPVASVLVAAVRAVVVAVVDSSVVATVRAVAVAPFVVVISSRSSVVVPFGSSPAVGKAQGAEEGNDDKKKDGLDVHCV